jgi:D-glycero-beta-D-manno-heptose 1-phosphate adenylyltransferase
LFLAATGQLEICVYNTAMLSFRVLRVLQTLAYTDQFSYPLRLDEVWKRLLSGEFLSISEVKKDLLKLEKIGLVGSRAGYYFLSSRADSVKIRLERQKIASQKYTEVDQVVSWLRWIPWVQAIVVTGSLAVDAAQPGDDSDFMIVTQAGRLWQTRILVLVIATLVGKRRYWWEDQDNFSFGKTLAKSKPKLKSKKSLSNSSIKTKWCFNMWLTTQGLAVPAKKRSIYVAYEICQSKFVFDRGKIEVKFLSANSWVKSILPHYYRYKHHQLKNVKPQPILSLLTMAPASLLVEIAAILTQPLWWLVEIFTYLVQKQYMMSHMTTETVTMNSAYFHPRQTKKLIIDGWRSSLTKVLKFFGKSNPALKSAKKLTAAAKSKPTPVDHKPYKPFQPSPELKQFLALVSRRNQNLVFVTGVFDVLHKAHRMFLVKARIRGDVLIVGIESDFRVKQMKGESRPVYPQDKRQAQLENLGVADFVFVLPENFSDKKEHLAMVELLKPKVLAVSAHTPHLGVKRRLMKKVGGKLEVVMEQDQTVSTTKLIKELGV